MPAPRRLSFLAMGVAAAALLAACGGAPTAAVQPTAAPAPTARPTSTPRPTPKPKPTAAPEPTDAPEPTAEAEPTAETATNLTGKIDMSDMQTYSYETGIFSVDMPQSWAADDRSSAGEVLVRFTDKTENGVVLVNLLDQAEAQSDDQLTKLLTDYLDNTYSSKPNYSHDDPKKQSDGSILVVWGYDVDLSTGKTVRLLGNSFVEQRDSLVSVFTIALPNEQFDTLSSDIDTLINSYKIDTSVAVAPAAPTDTTTTAGGLKPVVIGDLETFQHETGLFSIDVPNNWQLNDTSKPGEAIMLWLDPDQNAFVAVDIYGEPSEQSQDQLTTLLNDYLSQTFGSQTDFNAEEAKPQSDGSVLIVWTYTTEVSGIQAKMLGNSFVEQRGDKVSILTTLVPNDQFDTLQPDTNNIVNSYKIDPSVSLS